MLTSLIAISWISLGVWGAASSARGPVFWAVVGFVLSQTIYVPSIAAMAAELVGSAYSCNQFMNVWGELSAIAVVVSLVAGRRLVRCAVLALGGVSVAALFVLARVERPDPVGCITAIDVPWTSPYWWILVVSHVASSGIATVVIARLARRSWPADRSLALGSSIFAFAFLASTLFWVKLGIVLVTGSDALGGTAQSRTFPLTVLATTLALVITVTDRGVRLVRARREIDDLWKRWREQATRLRPDDPLPRRRDVVGPWWQAPAQAVHHLRVQVADNDLFMQRTRRDDVPVTPAGDEGQ